MPISAPDKIITPWATSGLREDIPQNADPVNGRAGFDVGFPPINMTPKTAGGIPPFGQDFNGIFFDVTQAIQFLQAGGSFPYDGAWAEAVGGYPIGALVSRTDNQGMWRNTVANNLTDPESGGAGWQPEGSGATSITMASSNVTLTPLQSAADIIIITGTLTANLQLIFPQYVKQWLVVNNATGAYTVNCRTSAGSGVTVSTGASSQIYGDGTNILQSQRAVSTDGIRGSYQNLSVSATGLNATVSITAAAICVKNAANEQIVLNAVSESCNLLASGAGGLDAGSLAANTWYALYLIYNPTTSDVSSVASLSFLAPTLPSGYSHWAFIEAVRSNAGATLVSPLRMTDGICYYNPTTGSPVPNDFPIALGNGSAVSLTAVSISAFVPPSAKSALMALNCSGPNTGTAQVRMSSAAASGLLVLSVATGQPIAPRIFFEFPDPQAFTPHYSVAGSGSATILVLGWRS